ncbi:alpha-catulin-like [Pollicipes pollicipes]|uniref:alpha-catulin-like n=1 Tax=Pollicipes pollicipes TaxID=41117 RepID=UPI0018855CD5|nr:alpha-catulin-like [Pollicipes pollicipes]
MRVLSMLTDLILQHKEKKAGLKLWYNLKRFDPGLRLRVSAPPDAGCRPGPQVRVRPGPLDQEEQAKISKSGLEMKLANDEMAAETDKWQEASDEDNDILRRAKAMSQMALGMYQFTRGDGILKTTQDLFTQAEYFTEEANRLYKVVRQFSYQVPQGANKKELLEYLDQIPTHVQQLQFAVKTPTVARRATFTKVDNVIQDTKSAMNVISKVVNICFACAIASRFWMCRVVVRCVAPRRAAPRRASVCRY